MKVKYPRYIREQNLSCKLTDEQIKEIPILYYRYGFIQREIAKKFGVGKTTVQRWLKTPEERKEMDRMTYLLYENRSTVEDVIKYRKRKLQMQGEDFRKWERAYRKPLRKRPEWKERRRKIWQRYYKNNRKKVLLASKKWALKNKERLRKYRREWEKKNKERRRLQRKKWYLENIEKIRKYQREWHRKYYQKNKEKLCLYNRIRCQKKKLENNYSCSKKKQSKN